MIQAGQEISFDFESLEGTKQENHTSLCCFRGALGGRVLKSHNWQCNQQWNQWKRCSFETSTQYRVYLMLHCNFCFNVSSPHTRFASATKTIQNEMYFMNISSISQCQSCFHKNFIPKHTFTPQTHLKRNLKRQEVQLQFCQARDTSTFCFSQVSWEF